jgi:hypothetical protein
MTRGRRSCSARLLAGFGFIGRGRGGAPHARAGGEDLEAVGAEFEGLAGGVWRRGEDEVWMPMRKLPV